MQIDIINDIIIRKKTARRLREPYSKSLGDGIFEIRAKVGTDITRVLYFFYYEGRIILTNGFVKIMQETPSSEIKKVKQYRKDFLERYNK
jgi:phage-related protein